MVKPSFHKYIQFIKLRSEHILCALIFFFLLLFGILTLNTYGIHVDDFSLAKQGMLVSNKLLDPTNNSYVTNGFMRYYSPFFEVFAHLIISYFGIAFDTLNYYLARKFLIYLSFLSGLTFYYLILRKYFPVKTSVLGTASLFLIPSFFGYASVTSKEIPLISFTIISIYFLLGYYNQSNYRNLILHGLFLGIAIAIRPSALVLIPITALIFINIFFRKLQKKKKPNISIISSLLASIFIFFLVIIIPSFVFDPFLWEYPIENYKSRLDFMSNFDMGGSIMIMGETMRISESRTIDMFLLGVRKIPESFIFLLIVGAVSSLINLINRKLKNTELIIVATLWISLPLITIFIKETKFYNFRHLLIFLPPIGILTTFGINYLINKKNLMIKNSAYMLVVAGLIISFINIRYLFPYEVSYFNSISGGLEKNSSLYSNYPEGIAEKEAIQFLCNSNDEIYKISGPFVGMYIPFYCPNKVIYEPDYTKSNFVITYDFYEELIEVPAGAELIGQIERENASILNIYKHN